MSQTHTIGKHATTVGRDVDGTIRVTYHSTNIVTVNPDGSVRLDSGGYRSATTKTRMNQASNQLGLGFTVFQKDFDWFVVYKGEIQDFEDGMILA